MCDCALGCIERETVVLQPARTNRVRIRRRFALDWKRHDGQRAPSAGSASKKLSPRKR